VDTREAFYWTLYNKEKKEGRGGGSEREKEIYREIEECTNHLDKSTWAVWIAGASIVLRLQIVKVKNLFFDDCWCW
jgi:hypothetical protein